MKIRTAKGKMLDMSQLMADNQTTVALGNASMNARGDIVNGKGEVIKDRNQIAKEYYATNPKAVKQVSIKDISKEVFVTPQEAIAQLTTPVESVKEEVVKEKESSVAPPTTPRKQRKIEDRED